MCRTPRTITLTLPELFSHRSEPSISPFPGPICLGLVLLARRGRYWLCGLSSALATRTGENPADTTYDIARPSRPSGREQQIVQTGQGACLLMNANVVCLHRIPSDEGIGGVYHSTDTLVLGVCQDRHRTYEVSAGQKGDTMGEPLGRAAFAASRVEEVPALTVMSPSRAHMPF